MDFSPRIGLPYLLPNQTQKHVTLNESLRRLDTLVQACVVSRTLPLATIPQDGTCQIVAPGDGPGDAGDLACFQDGGWIFLPPHTGWRVFVADEGVLVVFDGVAWTPVSVPEVLQKLGVSTSADATNRLAVASAASLFTHDGAGHQLKVNKNASGDTASLLFQSGWSGRAEMGLTGNDRFAVKVSADGANWQTALDVDPETGRALFPGGVDGALVNANLLINSGFRVNQRGYSGASLAAGAYGHDRWRAGVANTQYAAISGGVSLTVGTLEQVIDVTVTPQQSVTFSAIVSAAPLSVTCLGQTVVLQPAPARQAAVFNGPASTQATVTLSMSGAGASAIDMKLETGTRMSAFVERALADEVTLCRFYYEQVGPGPGTYNPIGMVVAGSSSLLSGFVPHGPKRIIPSVTISGAYQCVGLPVSSSDITSMLAFSKTLVGFELRLTLNKAVTSGQAGLVRTQNDAAAFIAISAEH